MTPNKLQIFTVHSLAEFAATPDNVNALMGRARAQDAAVSAAAGKHNSN